MHESICVYAAAHRQIAHPLPAYCRLIQVNAAKNGRWDGYLHDDDGGDDISRKNDLYCELTALYSLWKNCDADIQGLCHYRRLLGERSAPTLWAEGARVVSGRGFARRALSADTIRRELAEADVLLALPAYPYPTTAGEDLLRFCRPEDIRILRDVVAKYHPAYAEALEAVLGSTHISYCNIFLARRAFVDGYCAWLFDVLEKVEAEVCADGGAEAHPRLIGYLGEALMNVYIRKHGLRCRYHYILQVYEGTHPSRLLLRRAANGALALLGRYPIVPNRRHEAACFAQLRRTLASGDPARTPPAPIPGDPEKLECYLRYNGAQETEIRRRESYTVVFGRFAYELANIAIAVFVLPEGSDLFAVLDRMETERAELRAALDEGETLLLWLGGADLPEEADRALQEAEIRRVVFV